MTVAIASSISRNISQHITNKISHLCNQCKSRLASSYVSQFQPLVSSVASSEDGQFVTVSWQDGQVKKYPYIWLRDNCRCSKCYDSPLMSRKFLFGDLDLNARMKSCENKPDGELVFRGTDGHDTNVQSAWLRVQDFGVLNMGPVFDKKLWSSNPISYLSCFNYEDVLGDDEVLYKWMQSVKVHGMAWINGAPKNEEALRRLTERIGHIRQTFYGVIFGVKSKEDTYFPGYTVDHLPLHTDYTFGANTPGVILFHGIERAPSGGKSMFVDGFKLAYELKTSDPTAYKLLCTGVMSFGCAGFDCGRHFDHRGQSKIINVDRNDRIEKISFSQHVRREGLANIPLEQVQSFYEAVQKFSAMIYSPHNLVKVMIEEGDIVTVDNDRVLHGREGFTTDGNRGRVLHGAYFDHDDFESQLRILSQKYVK